jgi:hypothetical protein
MESTPARPGRADSREDSAPEALRPATTPRRNIRPRKAGSRSPAAGTLEWRRSRLLTTQTPDAFPDP